MSASAGSPLMAASTVQPSRSGIDDVERDRGGFQFPRQAKPFAPPSAFATANPSRSRKRPTTSRTVGSSSTTRINGALRRVRSTRRRRSGSAQRGVAPPLANLRWQRDRECRAAAELALDGDVSAHHLAEAAADRETEPGSAVFAGGGRIGLENSWNSLPICSGVMPMPVSLTAIVDPVAGLPSCSRRDGNCDRAVLGELAGVADAG